MTKRARSPGLDRRTFVKLAGGGGVAAAAAACASKDMAEPGPAPRGASPPADATVVRVASVPTAVEGNVLPALIKQFEQRSPYRVQLTTSPLLYELARAGKADLVISHYGHRDAETFVMDGRGEWPRTIFSNQMALIGPPSDPARVRGLADAGEAFRRIAETRSKFVLNDLDGVHYLTEILWHAAGSPDRTGWFIDQHTSKEAAIKYASEVGAYSLWGLTPFLRLSRSAPQHLEPLVMADPLLQRMLVSIIVKPVGALGVNSLGATALQGHLLEPATQAQIRTVRYPGTVAVTWVPAGRHNRTAMLPKG
jgi:tungstate transport system substrate-binding protein